MSFATEGAGRDPRAAAAEIMAALTPEQAQTLLRLARSSGIPQRAPHYDRVEQAMLAIKEDETYITSLEDPDMRQRAGVVFAVPKHIAANHIARRTHRLSTPEEREAYLDDLERRSTQRQGPAVQYVAPQPVTSPVADPRKRKGE